MEIKYLIWVMTQSTQRSLFECHIQNLSQYDTLFHDIAKLCTLVLVYFLFNQESNQDLYIFNSHNSMLFFLGLCVYHLIFKFILDVQFK